MNTDIMVVTNVVVLPGTVEPGIVENRVVPCIVLPEIVDDRVEGGITEVIVVTKEVVYTPGVNPAVLTGIVEIDKSGEGGAEVGIFGGTTLLETPGELPAGIEFGVEDANSGGVVAIGVPSIGLRGDATLRVPCSIEEDIARGVPTV